MAVNSTQSSGASDMQVLFGKTTFRHKIEEMTTSYREPIAQSYEDDALR